MLAMAASMLNLPFDVLSTIYKEWLNDLTELARLDTACCSASSRGQHLEACCRIVIESLTIEHHDQGETLSWLCSRGMRVERLEVDVRSINHSAAAYCQMQALHGGLAVSTLVLTTIESEDGDEEDGESVVDIDDDDYPYTQHLTSLLGMCRGITSIEVTNWFNLTDETLASIGSLEGLALQQLTVLKCSKTLGLGFLALLERFGASLLSFQTDLRLSEYIVSQIARCCNSLASFQCNIYRLLLRGIDQLAAVMRSNPHLRTVKLLADPEYRSVGNGHDGPGAYLPAGTLTKAQLTAVLQHLPLVEVLHVPDVNRRNDEEFDIRAVFIVGDIMQFCPKLMELQVQDRIAFTVSAMPHCGDGEVVQVKVHNDHYSFQYASRVLVDALLAILGIHPSRACHLTVLECLGKLDLAALAAGIPSDRLTGLSILNVSGVINPTSLVQFFSHFTGTQHIKLRCGYAKRVCHLPSSCFISVAQLCPTLRSFVMVNISTITDDVLQQVAAACPKLELIDVYHCNSITDISLNSLATLLPGLQHLDVASTAVSAKGVSEMMTTHPSWEVSIAVSHSLMKAVLTKQAKTEGSMVSKCQIIDGTRSGEDSERAMMVKGRTR